MAYEIDFIGVGDGSRGGDAIALRFGNNLMSAPHGQTVAVIDGGWTDTGKLLADHIRHFYKTDRVDLVISTHPDDDHSNGLITLLNELTVGCLAMHLPWDHTEEISRLFRDGRVTDQGVREELRRSLDSACGLSKIAKLRSIPVVEPFEGVGGFDGRVKIVGPSLAYYESLLPNFRCTPDPRSVFEDAFGRHLLAELRRRMGDAASRAAESFGFETLRDDGETTPENNSSVITLLQLDGQNLLFTGDAGIPALTRAADRMAALGIGAGALNFLQVPHHGSRRNVGPTLLDRLVGSKRVTDDHLRMAYCSCPKESEKHPSRRVTNAFRRRGARVFLTQGKNIWYSSGAVPARPTYSPISPVPFYTQVEVDDE
jgi:beta-lactamase superfamily II metal-dependent hydrolase